MTATDLPSEAGPSAQIPSPSFPVLRVLPLPTSFTTGKTVLLISPDLSISYRSHSVSSTSPPADLFRAMERIKAHLDHTRDRYLSPTRGAEFFPIGNDTIFPLLSDLYLELDTVGDTISSITACARAAVEDRPELEAYTLSIPLKGPGVIRSKSALGLLRGLTTFEHLVYHVPTFATGVISSSPKLYAPFAPYEIIDKPAFGWRGLLLDTSRNWFGISALQKASLRSGEADTIQLLDSMSLVKLNVFHWQVLPRANRLTLRHITDSNSWPLDLKSRPELAALGAYSLEQKYSEAEIRDLFQYAGERGIDVLLEVDLPGHTASIYPSQPGHIASYNAQPFSTYAHQPPAGQLRFATDSTVKWTRGLVEDIVGLVGAEGSRYVGTGGDEVNVKCMTDDPVTARSLKEKGRTLDEALDNFTAEIHAPIRSAGKTPVVWQEMALAHGPMPSLSKDTLVHIWVSSKDAREVLQKGFRIVHAPADYFYLDVGLGGWIATRNGSNSWIDPFNTWAKMLSFDPYECTRIEGRAGRPRSGEDGEDEDDLRKKVLGGQACLWAEQTDENNLESQVWPRAAAVADLFWTGDKARGGYPRNAIEALPRMQDVRYRMVDRDVRATPLQPYWCALRPELSVEGS